MRTHILRVVLFGACISSPAFAGADRCASSAEAIPLCTVLSDAAKYDSKNVTIRGYYRMVLHGSVLMSPACGETYVNVRQASDYKADKHASAIMRSLTKQNQFQSVAVVYPGHFPGPATGSMFRAKLSVLRDRGP